MQSLRHETKEPRPAPKKIPKLGLVTTRREAPETLVEEALEPISHEEAKEISGSEQAFMLEMASRFVASFEKEKGRLHLEGARIQNEILHAVHTGRIKNFDRFTRQFQEAASVFLGKEDFIIEGMPFGHYLTTIFDGILTDIEVVRRLEQSFNKRKPSAESRQFLATNDFLDARHKVDLIEISYRPGEPPIVERVWLVQVKRSEILPDQVEKIHRVHEGFVRNLVSKGAFEIDRHSREKQGAAKAFETNFSLTNVQDGMKSFLEGVVKAGGLIRSQTLEQLFAGASLPSAVLKKWLIEPEAASVFKVLLEGSGVSALRSDAIYQQLSRWAAQYPPTQAEMLAALPPSESPSEIIGATTFESIVSHGKTVEKRIIVLPPGDIKALTAA